MCVCIYVWFAFWFSSTPPKFDEAFARRHTRCQR